MPVAIAFIRAYFGAVIPTLKAPNLKFISPNKDGRYSGGLCQSLYRGYTGELVIGQKIIGPFNFAPDAPDAPDAMKDRKLPTTGEHDTFDVIHSPQRIR